MSKPTVFLLDDAVAAGWSPFAETRPIGELRFGALTLRERALLALGGTGGDHVGCACLEGFEEPDAGAITELPSHAPSTGCWVWLSRAAVDLAAFVAPTPSAPLTLRIDSEDVARYYAPGAALPDSLESLDGGEESVPRQEIAGVVLNGPWDLVEANARCLTADLLHLCAGRFEDALPAGVQLVGESLVSLGADVEIGPGVILDTRNGPIRLDDGCTVDGPARLVGPLHLGPGCSVFGGHLGALSVGPRCKLRGEIDSTVICGFSNKAHDGYLGHALLGRWVNLGAMTTNSDLKNNYSQVRVSTGSGNHDTGLMKVGVFLGDHVKTGIGTLLNTGTAVGAGSNLFGGSMPPKWIPPFSWCGPDGITPYRFDRFDEVAHVVTSRRGQEWPDGMSALFRQLFNATHGSND